MPLGPGKYDDLATIVREQAEAQAVIVVVFNGNKGHGFAVQAEAEIALHLPGVLEEMARQMREAVSAREVES
jgi:hypothetical protein